MEGQTRWWPPAPNPTSDVMNQLCRVCGEPAAGFHFGAFTCEGCKSFFGRTYNNLGSISECKNNGECVINKKNRTSCKACRLRKCLMVGMSKSGSRYGRRSNWFKIHCLLQEQQQQAQQGVCPVQGGPAGGSLKPAKWDDAENNNSEPRGLLLPHPATALPYFVAPFHPPPFPPHPAFFPFLPRGPQEASLSSSSTPQSTPSPVPPPKAPTPPPPDVAKSVALLRSLGPVQDAPMDLSRSRPERSPPPQRISPPVKKDPCPEEELQEGRRTGTPLDLTCVKT